MRRLGAIAVVSLLVAVATASAGGEPAHEDLSTGLYGYEPLTPWRQPPVSLPVPRIVDYAALAAEGLRQARRWRRGVWYCEYLGCTRGPYPLATLWATVPLFETLDALETAQPSPAHKALLDRFARQSERYWDQRLGGYAPYPGDRGATAEAWFDDNGWIGLAYLNAYRATHETRWLRDAQRAFGFVAARGWDGAGGGGMWWNTHHPYHSGPALAADALLGMLLYEEDHRSAQMADAQTWMDWANVHDVGDERHLYLEQPNQPESVNDYVQAPLVYAQYLLCKDGQGEGYCVRAGRVAATMAEGHAIGSGYRDDFGPEYDTIYLQWMMAYGRATGESYWLAAAQLNGAAATEHVASGQGLWLSSWWGGPIPDPETHPNMLRTVAATTSLFAWLDVYAGPA